MKRIAPALLIAATTPLALSVPAAAHSVAACKYAVYNQCMANDPVGGPNHAACVALAQTLCTHHAHTGGGSVEPGASNESSDQGRTFSGRTDKRLKFRKR